MGGTGENFTDCKRLLSLELELRMFGLSFEIVEQNPTMKPKRRLAAQLYWKTHSVKEEGNIRHKLTE